MARINIEDTIWKDDRFQDLIVKAGDRLRAKGMILELWTLAQEYWFPERRLIPLERIERAGLRAVIDTGLAVVQDAGIFAVGTEHAFDWLFQKQKAGEESGKARRARKPAQRSKKTGTAVSARSTPVDTRSTYVNETEPLTLTLSPSLPLSSFSDSSSSSDSEEKKGIARDVKSRRTPAKTSAVWEAYSEAYAERFGQRPADNAMERKHLSRFVDMVGAHDAPSIAAFFIRHPNAYYIQKGYPTWLLAQDAQKLRTEWLTGNRITRAKAQDAERAYDNLEAFGLVGGHRGK